MMGSTAVRRYALARACAIALTTLGALSCSGNPDAKTAESPKPKTRMERLERYHERAKVVAKELDEMGFGVRPSEITLLLGQRDQDKKILIESTVYGARFASREALAGFRRLAGLKSGVTAMDAFASSVAIQLFTVPTYYDPVGQYLVFREAWMGQIDDVDELVAHGLAHAHQDQAQGGIEAFLSVNSNTLDRSRVARAVLEGEASLVATGLAFKRRKRDVGELDLSLEDGGLDYALSDEGSGLITSSGQRFALAQYRRGGWPAVREAYRTPPESSEQLLHPEKYPADAPRVVTLPPWPDPGALVKQTASDVIGELMLFGTLAESFGKEGDPLLAARDEAELATIGWDGDRIEVYELPDGEHAALFRSVWDLEDSARDFARVLRQALEKNDADLEGVIISQRGAVVDVAFSEDPDVLPSLAQALANHPASFAANAEDAKSTLHAREAQRERSRKKPRVDGQYWVHSGSGVSVPLPDDDWEPSLYGGKQVLMKGKAPDALLSTVRIQDLWDHDLQAFLKYAEQSLFSNPRFEQVEVLRRAISGTDVGVVTFNIPDKTSGGAGRFRFWLIPRDGHYFLLLAGFFHDDWDDIQPVLDRIERGLRIAPAD